MKRWIPILMLLMIFALPLVAAEVSFNKDLTKDEKVQIDKIIAPVMKIYNVVKYTATVIGVLMFVFAGITFVISGGEQAKKEKAKNMAVGVIIGLMVIWVAPLVVKFVFS